MASVAETSLQPMRPVSDGEFRALYEAHFDYVWHSLRRLGVPDRDIEDLCHDVFVAFYRGRDDYDPARPLKPWLFGIAFRVASDYRRLARNRLETPGAGAVEPPDVAPAADDRMALAQRWQIVAQALDALDLDRRAVFVMHDIDGHAMPEIATTLQVPLNTLYSRLRLAREQFAAAIRRLRLRRGEP